MSTNQAVDLFNAFATDEVAEVEGVETQLPNCGSAKFKIARAFNPHYRRVLKRLYDKHQTVLKAKGPEAEAKNIELEIELTATTILVGWIGTIPFNGEQLAYSKENAMKLLTLKDFRALVIQFSENADNFKLVKDSLTEEEEKN